MIEPTHYRHAHRIQEIPNDGQNGNVSEYPSINAAKRASREIGLGRIRTTNKLHNIGVVTHQYKAKSDHDVSATSMPSAGT